MTKADDFLLLVDDHGREVVPYWADALEEEGRVAEARCVREKWPLEQREQGPSKGGLENLSEISLPWFAWFPEKYPHMASKESIIPDEYAYAMKEEGEKALGKELWGRYYTSLSGAWAELLRAAREVMP